MNPISTFYRRFAARALGILVFFLAAPPASHAAPDDACTLLTPAQVTAALNSPVPAAMGPGGLKTLCSWAAPGHGSVTLAFVPANQYEANKKPAAPVEEVPVNGIGDEAYFLVAGTNVGLFVKKGGALFKVTVYFKMPVDKLEAIEKTLASQAVANL